VVVRMGLNLWGQDPGHRVPRALNEGYRRVAEVCDDTVYLRRDLTRALPPATTCR
jgi:hypothetical protein